MTRTVLDKVRTEVKRIGGTVTFKDAKDAQFQINMAIHNAAACGDVTVEKELIKCRNLLMGDDAVTPIEIAGYELGRAIARTAHGNAALLAVTNTIMDRLNLKDWNAFDNAIDKGMEDAA